MFSKCHNAINSLCRDMQYFFCYQEGPHCCATTGVFCWALEIWSRLSCKNSKQIAWNLGFSEWLHLKQQGKNKFSGYTNLFLFISVSTFAKHITLLKIILLWNFLASWYFYHMTKPSRLLSNFLQPGESTGNLNRRFMLVTVIIRKK